MNTVARGGLTEASPCPGPALLSQHTNGMSLALVMRFLTLGSTPSMPNQTPKIISTGNAFLTRFPQSEFPFFSLFFSSYVCALVCVSHVLWSYFWGRALDVTKWHRTPWRIIFWMLWRWEEHQRVTYFSSQPYTAIPPQGAHTKDWWAGGRRRRWEGRVSRAAAKEKNT